MFFCKAPACKASWLTEFQDGGRPRIVPLDSKWRFPENGGGRGLFFGARRVSCGVVLFQKVWPYGKKQACIVGCRFFK